MENAKDLLLADAVATAIKAHKRIILLRRITAALAAGCAVLGLALILVIVYG